MVMRQKDNGIKAFYNTCAHRGMKLVRGSGCADEGDLRCEFHGWRYGLDGRSSFVPCRDEFASRPASSGDSLRSRSARGVAGCLSRWPRIRPNLLEWLDPIPTALAPFRLQDMRYRWRKRTFLPANYKTVIDAFIEGYHTPGTHPQTLRPIAGAAAIGRTRTAAGIPLRPVHANLDLPEPFPLRVHPATRHRRPRQCSSGASCPPGGVRELDAIQLSRGWVIGHRAGLPCCARAWPRWSRARSRRLSYITRCARNWRWPRASISHDVDGTVLRGQR